MTGGAKGGRDLVAQYAGHLANLINGNDHLSGDVPVVEIRPFQLYERVFRGLSANRRYLEGLVGLWSYPTPQDPGAAADFYFDQVLDRPIGRRPGKPSSADNLRTFLAAAAAAPWHDRGSGGAELSTWKAVVDGPSRIRRFLERSALYELSNLILKCLDAANRPYAEVLRLGLCPRDWLSGSEEVTVNTLKAANMFLRALRTAMREEVGRRPTPEELETAFAEAPVPGSGTGAAFARTPLGAAILTRVAGNDVTRVVSFDQFEAVISDTVADEDAGEDLMAPNEAAPILDRAVDAGAVSAEERHLLAAILEGAPLAEAIRDAAAIRRRVKADFDGDIGAYVADLSARVAGFSRRDADARP